MLLADGFVSIMALGAPRPGGNPIIAQYSRYSGLVTETRMGRRGDQPVRLGFDFTETDSFVYDSSECPAFVGPYPPVNGSQRLMEASKTAAAKKQEFSLRTNCI
jgi:hypothetical protein